MIDPIALEIGPFAIRWYGISYAVGLFVGIWILSQLNRKRKAFKDTNQIFDFAFWLFLVGVIVGGRLGYVLFYNLPYFLENPAKSIAIWEGGMSFHGGLFASIAVAYFFFKKHKINFWDAADLAVIPGALALTFTRAANFVNRELVGRVVENPDWHWIGVDFGDGLLRFPSQLFQSASAFLQFLILLFIFTKKPKRGVLVFSYFFMNGLFRFIIEFWREPDVQVGYILNFFTLGQLLSALVLGAGALGLFGFFRPLVSRVN